MRLLISCLLISGSVFGQLEDWYGSDLSRLGYKHTKFTFENGANGSMEQWSSDPLRTIKGGSTELSSDIFGKHFYFGIDGSTLLDVGITLFQFKNKERWWKNSEYFVLRSEILPMRLGFGTNIGKYFAVYGGGQYQLFQLGIDYRDNSSNRRDVRIWGHQYGAGVHAVAAHSNVLVKYSYLHDWIGAARTFDGHARTHELTVHLGVAKL